MSAGPADRIGAKLDAEVPAVHYAADPTHQPNYMARAMDATIGIPQPDSAPYTPNTEQVRTEWVESGGGSETNRMHAGAAFDRWLAQTLFEARTEAVATDRAGRAWEDGAWL